MNASGDSFFLRAIRQFLTTLRPFAVRIWVFLLWITGRLRRARKSLSLTNSTVVLLMHRVLDKESLRLTCSQPDLVLRQSTFERMLRYVTSEFEIVDIAAAPTGSENLPKLPRLALTFDDGWIDSFTTAFPAASAARLNFSVFLCPQLVGKTLPFWPERVTAGMRAKDPKGSPQKISALLRRLQLMPASERDRYISALPVQSSGDVDSTFGWDAALLMQQAGVTFGSHTSTHQMLTRIPPPDARREIFDSRIAIRSRLAQPCEVFAYPNGDVSPRIRDLVKESGYRLAFTTQAGFWTSTTDPLQIPRIQISERSVTGLTGRFSRSMFDYLAVWKQRP